MASDLVAGTGDVVRFVNDHEVPASIDDRTGASFVVFRNSLRRPSDASSHRLYGVERTDDLIERSPRIDTDINGHAARTHEYELLAEAVGHLGDPLQLHALRRNDEHTTDDPAGLELSHDESSFDRLTEPHLVGQ
jgi:hypothetical protein